MTEADARGAEAVVSRRDAVVDGEVRQRIALVDLQ